jgi:hypothetical protein
LRGRSQRADPAAAHGTQAPIFAAVRAFAERVDGRLLALDGRNHATAFLAAAKSDGCPGTRDIASNPRTDDPDADRGAPFASPLIFRNSDRMVSRPREQS